jgi:hypothetical protein
LVAAQLALVGLAPADARGYRVGIQQGQRLMRWFPQARSRTPPMFLIEPFEQPVVPIQGTYAVVYLDDRCLPLGGPRFTIAVEQVDRRLLLTDGIGRTSHGPGGDRRSFETCHTRPSGDTARCVDLVGRRSAVFILVGARATSSAAIWLTGSATAPSATRAGLSCSTKSRAAARRR